MACSFHDVFAKDLFEINVCKAEKLTYSAFGVHCNAPTEVIEFF